MTLQVKAVVGIADVEALETKPWESVLGVNSTYDLLRLSATTKGDEKAITFLPTGSLDEEPVRISYRQLFGRITQAANMFSDLGAGPRDAVSFLLPLLPQAHFTMWGAQAAGIANPINFLLQPDQIADLLNTAETKILVALGPHPVLDIWQKVVSIRERVPSLKAILRVGKPEAETEGVYNFDDLIGTYPADRLVSGRQFSRNDIATYFHTGGTTGAPRLAQHSQGNTVYAVWAVAHMWAYTEETVQTNMLPLFHVAGSIITALSPLCAGSQIVILTPGGLRNPQALQNHWRLVEKYRATHIGGVPTNLVQLLNVPRADADLSSVKYCVTGGSPLPLAVERAWKKDIGIGLSQMYGMTEAGSLVTMNPAAGEARLGAVGLRLPYESLMVVSLNADGSLARECGPNEAGVVMVKGPNGFPGYRDPTQNAGTLTEDNWLVSGDLGYFDEHGDLFLTGRAKDLIIRSAHNIDPAIIEEAMAEHPDVELSAAVGKPDAYAGELPVVYVQLKPGASISADQLMEFASQKISERPALPKEIVIVEEMPLTAVGKIYKPTLRWQAAKNVLAEALKDLGRKGVEVSVDVGEDRSRGILATITLSGAPAEDWPEIEREVESIVGKFVQIKHVIQRTT